MASHTISNNKSLFRKALVGVCLLGTVGAAAHGAFKGVAAQCTSNKPSNEFCQDVESYNNSKTAWEALRYEAKGFGRIVRHSISGLSTHGLGN